MSIQRHFPSISIGTILTGLGAAIVAPIYDANLLDMMFLGYMVGFAVSCIFAFGRHLWEKDDPPHDGPLG